MGQISKHGILELDETIGEGAFAVTWLADVRDKHLEKKWAKRVAVKLPKTRREQRAIMDDILNMARIQGALSIWEHRENDSKPNPHLVRFFGMEEFEEGWGMACEYVPGMDMEKFLDTPSEINKLDYLGVVDLGIQMATGLEVLSEANIFHRDLKPSNILMVKRGKKWVVKLSDFGLSTMVEKGMEATVTNSKVGNLAYRPGEYIKEPERALSPAWDIYAVGMILYHLTCRKLPFTSNSVICVCKEAPDLARDWPHPHGFTQFEAPNLLCQVIMTAISKLPENRYASPTLLKQALEKVREDLNAAATYKPPHVPELEERLQPIRESLENLFAGSLENDKARAMEKEFEDLARLYPNQPEVFVLWGGLYRAWNNSNETRCKVYRQGLERCPSSSILHYELGMAILRQNRPEGAKEGLESLKQAIQLGLDDPKLLTTAKNMVRSNAGRAE